MTMLNPHACLQIDIYDNGVDDNISGLKIYHFIIKLQEASILKGHLNDTSISQCRFIEKAHFKAIFN